MKQQRIFMLTVLSVLKPSQLQLVKMLSDRMIKDPKTGRAKSEDEPED